MDELLAERGVDVDHVTVYRWVQRFTRCWPTPPASPATPGDRWFVDETYVRVNGVRRYVYRAIDQYGQVIDVLVSTRRDAAAARRFFSRALRLLRVIPSEVVTGAAPVYPVVLEELVPAAWNHVGQYANNPIEADHGQLKWRLRPMRGSPLRSQTRPSDLTSVPAEIDASTDLATPRRPTVVGTNMATSFPQVSDRTVPPGDV